ncbi:hypothetical protein [Nocardioides speluncae]|uniref:hypothetical protein n=1 Tax=Nocardioides speluncae TaxID=2670337 RepID=UPI00197CF4BE|nr:hypothetical protein [Nocardioides speluncae]
MLSVMPSVTLSGLLASDDGELVEVAVSDDPPAVSGRWAVDGTPVAVLRLLLPTRDSGLVGEPPAECDVVMVDNKVVLVYDLAPEAAGYLVSYGGPRQSVLVEWLRLPGATSDGLSRKRLAELASSDHWQG